MIKTILLIVGFLLVYSSPLYAGPASPDPVDIQQPDGSVIKAMIKGDERQGWTESADSGHTIIHNKNSGYWEYAEQAQDGSLRPNGLRVLPNGRNAPANLQKGLRPPRNKFNEKHMQHQLVVQPQVQAFNSSSSSGSSAGTVAASAAALWSPVPVTGDRKLLIILVSFTDRSIKTTSSNWYSKIFDETDKSVAKFYKDNSLGQVRIIPVTHLQPVSPSGIVSVTIPTIHPYTDGSYTEDSDRMWGNAALAKAATYVDFDSFDTNGNGILEPEEISVFFIVAGYEASGTTLTPSVWAHVWSGSGSWVGLTVGSKNIQRWGQNGELNSSGVQQPMGVTAHELGHQICGLPDLYDVSDFNAGLGVFSTMATGSWGMDTNEASGTTPTSLDAWSREFLGWSPPVTPDMSSPASPISFAYQLSSTITPYKLILPTTSTSEYFLLENRYPNGWDRGLKGLQYFGSGWSGGLLVLHVDNNAGKDINDYTNNASHRQGVVPVQANTSTCNMLVSGASTNCRGNPKTLFYSGNNSVWTPVTTPNSNYYSGVSTNFYTTAISAPGSTMTAEFSYGSPTVPGAPSMGLATRGNGQVSVTFAAPKSDGGAAITQFTVRSSPAGKSASGLSSPLIVSGLTNGTAYTFTVTATNTNGTSLPSQVSNSVIPATVPDAPSIGAVVAGSGQAEISFTPPFFNGGSTITSYTVRSNSGQLAMDTTSPIVVYGLTDGAQYSFTVNAINNVGSSSASSATPNTTTGPVRISEFRDKGYLTLQDAYDAIQDVNGATIQLVTNVSAGALVKTSSSDLFITGGFDAAYLQGSQQSGAPSIIGKLSLQAGKTCIQNIVIR